MQTESNHLDYVSLVKASIDVLILHLGEEQTTADLATAVGYSAYHFHRIFAAIAGETVGEMRRRLRLEQAAQRLVATEVPISEVALDGGYATPQAFSTSYRQHFGESPTETRARGWIKIQPNPNGVFWSKGGLVHEFIRVRHKEMNMNVEVKNIEPIHAVGLRHIGPYHEIGATFEKLFGIIMSQQLPIGPTLGVYHDDPGSTPPSELRSDAALVVPQGFEGNATGLNPVNIAGGKYAVARYEGAYSGLGKAWEWLYGEWLPNSQEKTASGVCFEMYVRHDQNDPNNCVTDIYVPLT